MQTGIANKCPNARPQFYTNITLKLCHAGLLLMCFLTTSAPAPAIPTLTISQHNPIATTPPHHAAGMFVDSDDVNHAKSNETSRCIDETVMIHLWTRGSTANHHSCDICSYFWCALTPYRYGSVPRSNQRSVEQMIADFVRGCRAVGKTFQASSTGHHPKYLIGIKINLEPALVRRDSGHEIIACESSQCLPCRWLSLVTATQRCVR